MITLNLCCNQDQFAIRKLSCIKYILRLLVHCTRSFQDIFIFNQDMEKYFDTFNCLCENNSLCHLFACKIDAGNPLWARWVINEAFICLCRQITLDWIPPDKHIWHLPVSRRVTRRNSCNGNTQDAKRPGDQHVEVQWPSFRHTQCFGHNSEKIMIIHAYK